MKTNKLLKAILLAGVLIAFGLPVASAKTDPVRTENSEIRIAELQKRLDEINSLDTRNMSRKEKKVLRTEVKQIKQEMETISGGVYLSVGAIILIALLLILLL